MAKPVTTTKSAAVGVSKVKPEIIGINTGLSLTMPTPTSKRGSTSEYPFGALAVGQSFGVKNKKASELQGIVSNQNRKPGVQKTNPDGTPMFKMAEVIENGEKVMKSTGEPIYDDASKKHFFVVDCDAKTDPEGASCRVWRNK